MSEGINENDPVLVSSSNSSINPLCSPSALHHSVEKVISSELTKGMIDSEKEYGCSHYKRKCQLVCPNEKCMGKSFTCRFCHDECITDHQLDRYGVTQVICLLCNELQPATNLCSKCGVTFGKYHCKICNLYIDNNKETFHCHACGLCRVGDPKKFFHCEKCSMCLPISLKDGQHKCIEKASRRDCPVCLEDIHTSRHSSHVPPCGHLLHQSCYKQLMDKCLYACPLCNQSMVDMKRLWKFFDQQIANSPPLPPEFTNLVEILCRDCHKLSSIRFHFIGLKCGHCGGYNTCIERGTPLNADAFNSNVIAREQQHEEMQTEDTDVSTDEEGYETFEDEVVTLTDSELMDIGSREDEHESSME